jgi:hypothetical protein
MNGATRDLACGESICFGGQSFACAAMDTVDSSGPCSTDTSDAGDASRPTTGEEQGHDGGAPRDASTDAGDGGVNTIDGGGPGTAQGGGVTYSVDLVLDGMPIHFAHVTLDGANEIIPNAFVTADSGSDERFPTFVLTLPATMPGKYDCANAEMPAGIDLTAPAGGLDLLAQSCTITIDTSCATGGDALRGRVEMARLLDAKKNAATAQGSFVAPCPTVHPPPAL